MPVFVYVRQPQGCERAPQPKVGLLGRCQRWGTAERGRPAGLRDLYILPYVGGLCTLTCVCSEGHSALLAPGLLSSAVRREMLLLDCNSEVRLRPLLSYRLKSFQMSVFSEAFVRVKWTDHWALPSQASSELEGRKPAGCGTGQEGCWNCSLPAGGQFEASAGDRGLSQRTPEPLRAVACPLGRRWRRCLLASLAAANGR